MSNVKKLGKGLEDISYLFLSSAEENLAQKSSLSRPEIKAQPEMEAATKSICLIGNDSDPHDAFLIINLSLALARLGMRIAVVDMDEKFSCLKFFLGRELEEWEKTDPESLVKKGPLGVYLIGVNKKTFGQSLDLEKRQKLIFQLDKLEESVDLVLLHVMRKDLRGLNPKFRDSIKEYVLMVPPDKNKMLDSYRIIKTIFSFNPLAKIGSIITNIDHMYEIEAVYSKMSSAVKKFLDKELHKYGFLFKVKEKMDSTANISSFYDADLTACISNIAQIIVLRLNLGEPMAGSGAFFKNMLETLES